MKPIKSLLTFGMLVALSSNVFAETNTPLNSIKNTVKENATSQMMQTKQAITNTQNSAKSAVTDKITTQTNNTKTTLTNSKEKANTAVTHSKNTARETLNSAKTAANDKVTTAKNSSKKSKININTADVETLQALDGIGEAKAKAIVEYRKKHGNFKKASDLTKVSGIGDSTITKIKSAISFQ